MTLWPIDGTKGRNNGTRLHFTICAKYFKTSFTTSSKQAASQTAHHFSSKIEKILSGYLISQLKTQKLC